MAMTRGSSPADSVRSDRCPDSLRLDAPDQDAVDVQGHGLRVLVHEARVGDERVRLGRVEVRPVDVVYPRLDLSAVLASGHRSGPGLETDLEVRVGHGPRRGEDDEPAR